jgi:hypothetical protein
VIAFLLAALLTSDLVKAPKQPYLGFPWRIVELRGANEMKIHPEYVIEESQWDRLYGVDLPTADKKGYSGARQDLEILLGRGEPEAFIEDEKRDPVIRNATYVQYIWVYGKLLQFELVRDGWAKVNDEGRKGRYGKLLVAAEAEAQRFKAGLWGFSENLH